MKTKPRGIKINRDILKKAIKDTGLSREQLANDLGVSKQSIDRWVSNERLSTKMWEILKNFKTKSENKAPLKLYSLDELTNEIESRGWQITLSRK